ncbi:DUF7533 family protein [Halocalculus aciditolerans]|nr:hypothetical protein [Halocalculus aciditolerans]
MGIIGTLGFAGMLVVAAPLIVFGVRRSLAGDPFGYAALGLAVLLLTVPTVLPNPLDPGDYLEKLGGTLVKDPDED